MPIPAAFLLVALARKTHRLFVLLPDVASPQRKKCFPESRSVIRYLWDIFCGKWEISCNVFSNTAPTCTCWASLNLEGSRDNKNYIRRISQKLNSIPIKTEIAKVGHIINPLLTRVIVRPKYINKRNDKRNINLQLTSHQVKKNMYRLQLHVYRLLPFFSKGRNSDTFQLTLCYCQTEGWVLFGIEVSLNAFPALVAWVWLCTTLKTDLNMKKEEDKKKKKTEEKHSTVCVPFHLCCCLLCVVCPGGGGTP